MTKESIRYTPEELRGISKLRAVLIGLPASGKTTFVDKLKAVSPIKYVSLGAITRAELQKDTELARKLKVLFQDNQPWSDEFVLSILEPHLLAATNGFVLDGIPKKMSEARTMVTRFNEIGLGVDCIIALEVSKNMALDRITSRDNSGRLEQQAHYETRFNGWISDREAILSELARSTSHIKTIDTDKLSVEEVFTEGIDFLVTCAKGL